MRSRPRDFPRTSGVRRVLIARGEHGMCLLSGPDAVPHAAAREVSDVTGAGDTVVATLALALAAGATLEDGCGLRTTRLAWSWQVRAGDAHPGGALRKTLERGETARAAGLGARLAWTGGSWEEL